MLHGCSHSVRATSKKTTKQCSRSKSATWCRTIIRTQGHFQQDYTTVFAQRASCLVPHPEMLTLVVGGSRIPGSLVCSRGHRQQVQKSRRDCVATAQWHNVMRQFSLVHAVCPILPVAHNAQNITNIYPDIKYGCP